MSLVGIMSKDFGQGTVCITADTLSGYRSGHGKSSVYLWRKLLELTGHAEENEPVSIALINNRNEDYVSKLYELSPVLVEQLTLEQLMAFDLSKYDMIFMSGLSDSSESIRTKIADWVTSGGGLLIESPNIDGEIGIISELESVSVTSIQRPYKNKAYWTEYGKTSRIFTEYLYFSIMVEIDSSSLYGWNIYMSDVETTYKDDVFIQPSGASAGVYISQFTVSSGCYFNKGIVTLEEDVFDTSSFSSSSSESSAYDSSTSSSSSSQIDVWYVCDSVLAQWKMNDNASNNILDDHSHNVANIAYLYDGTSKKKTSSNSVVGRVNSAISFDGNTEYAKTIKTSNLRMADAYGDVDFAIALWVKIDKDTDGPILCKYGCWEIGIKNWGKRLYFKKTDDYDKTIEFSAVIKNKNNGGWNFIAINSYVDGTLMADLQFNNDKLTSLVYDEGYSGQNTNIDELLFGTNKTQYMKCSIDNVMVFSRTLTDIEIESLYNRGDGTENCEGIFAYTSSSETSSSSIDSSSSSVGTSSSSYSSSSISSFSSSSNSSSSSRGYSESSTSSSQGYSESSTSSSQGYSESSTSNSSSSSSLYDPYPYFNSIVPKMSSAFSPYPYAIVSSYEDGGAASEPWTPKNWKAFNDDYQTGYYTNPSATGFGFAWLSVDLGSGNAQTVKHYMISNIVVDPLPNDPGFGGNNPGPTEWYLQGSNEVTPNQFNDSEWSNLHYVKIPSWSEQRQPPSINHSTYEFSTKYFKNIGNNSSYRHYRLKLLGTSHVWIGQFKIST